MAYDINFVAYSGSDWAARVEAVDNDTNQPIDVTSMLIELVVKDRCGAIVVQATSADGSITKPGNGQFQWIIPKENLGGLCPGNAYRVGCRMTLTGFRAELFTGSLAYLDGEIQ